MTKDELKAKARELGLKVRTHWTDDAGENAIILIVGIVIGALLAQVFV